MSARAVPRLTFACELPSAKLEALLADSAVLSSLGRLGARVALALEDLSDERAEAVRRLKEAGIPVVAWLLLPREDGYFFTLDNGPAAHRRYREFRAWGNEHGLDWDAVAFDLEPALEDMRRAFEPGARLGLVRDAVARAGDAERLRAGSRAYAELIDRIHGDGLAVEAFVFPFLVDDRRAGSSLIHRVMSAPQLRPDREFLMLYTSFIASPGPAVLESYGPDAPAIAVGSTGGGVDAGGEGAGEALARTLGWQELARDLRIARRFSDEIAIFSLEGCARRGMLDRLESFDWDVPASAPGSALTLVGATRAVIRGGLRLASHPRLALGAALLALATRRRLRG